MSALHDVQAGFARAIVHGAQPLQVATGYANYAAETALEVYRNNYRGNLHDALAGAYPVIEQLVGAAFFRRVARAYISLYPSRNGNLHRYGEHFAEFVAGFEPAQSLPYLADVAALEWACHCAYFAADASNLEIGRLAQVPPEQYGSLILHLHPACHLVRSRYPVAAIWQAHQPGAPADFHIDLASGPCNALVSRSEDVVQVTKLEVDMADWLHAIQAGTTLGEATAAVLQHHPEFNLQNTLLQLFASGVLREYSLETTA